MKTPLMRVEILSIYKLSGQRILLPKRMAQCTPDMQSALLKIANDVNETGGKLYLSDMFRSYDMQLQAHLDWRTKKKKAYSPPPGGSMHEAGRAFDLSLGDLKISLEDFWAIAERWNVVPIISTPDRRKSEAWHFEQRGSHQEVYDYYKTGKGTNMKPYQAMTASSILSIDVNVDRFESRQDMAYLQSCLIRLGYELGNIDGIIGNKTRTALDDAEIIYEDMNEALQQVEDKLQQKFPAEFNISEVVAEDIFDYEIPEHIGS